MTLVDTWGYLGVLLAAATPWLEILLVIPAGVALGLAAVPVGLVAFVGNTLPVVGIVVAYEAVARRRAARRPDAMAAPPSGRRRRAARLMERYGLPALALAGPLVTGIHLATAMALALGARRLPVLWWMTASLAAWTLVLVVLAELGSSLLRGAA